MPVWYEQSGGQSHQHVVHHVSGENMADSLQEFVARENIKRFEQSLSSATSTKEKELLLRMIGDEKIRLRAATSRLRAVRPDAH